jgi:hypothetical protein
MARHYRNRHRQLYQLWNDTRLCSIQEFTSKYTQQQQQQQQKDGDFHRNDDNDITYDCQIIYTFVLGGYFQNVSYPNVTTEIPTLRVYNTSEEPVTLNEMPSLPNDARKAVPFKDVADNSDVTILNIRENMNQGKTSTFVYWASLQARTYKIPYIAKCDSDTMLRLPTMVQFLHQELPKIPILDNHNTTRRRQQQYTTAPSIVLGAPRHKNYGKWLSTVDESFWKREWFRGMHLYLSGEFYLMSSNLAERATEEARSLQNAIPHVKPHTKPKRRGEPEIKNDFHGYLEGHEDHDTTAMVEQGQYNYDTRRRSNDNSTIDQQPQDNPSIIQWMLIQKKSRFFEHPVKGSFRWRRIWEREQRRKAQNYQAVPAFDSDAPDVAQLSPGRRRIVTDGIEPLDENRRGKQHSVRSLLVVLGATDSSMRDQYRERLKAQGYRICNPKSQNRPSSRLAERQDDSCDLYQMFAVGKGSPSALLDDDDGDDDVVRLNVTDNIHKEMGQAVLGYIQENLGVEHYELVILCQAYYMFDVSQWYRNVVSTAQISLTQRYRHHLLIGDVRDKEQHPLEINYMCPNRNFFVDEHETIQLYLGSQCLALSSNLIPLILETARDTSITHCYANNLGE